MKKECIPGTPGLNSIKTFCEACLLNQHFINRVITEYPKLYFQFENFKSFAFLYNCLNLTPVNGNPH